MPTDQMRLIENDYVAVKQCKHGLFMYNVNDTFIGRSLDIYGEWCEQELSLFDQILGPGDFVVDVGANIGTHTVFFSNAVQPAGFVYAIEPQRVTYQFLCGNIALNALINVQCLNVGLGAESCSVVVPLLNPAASQNFGALNLEKSDHGEVVDVITLDQCDFDRCNLIKIDVEGAESKVLAGAKKTIERHRPVLFVENNTVEHSREIIEAIWSFDYQCWWHIAPYFNPYNYFQNTDNVFARFPPEANLLCIHKDLRVDAGGLVPVDGPDDDWRKVVERVGSARPAV